MHYSFNHLMHQIARSRQSLSIPYPTSIMLEITNHCQLSCITCAREYQFGKEMDRGNMKLELAKKIITDNYKYLDKIGLTGLGEPLLYNDLEKLLSYINAINNSISIFLSTNLQMPNCIDIINNLKDKFDTLQISIDGTGEVFESIRKPSRYDIFEKNLSAVSLMARKSRFLPKLNMVVFDKNFHLMLDVVKLADKYKIDEVFFNSINLVSNDWDLSTYNFYKTPMFEAELEKALLFAQKNHINVEYPKFNQVKGFLSCPYVWNNFYISWDGYLVMCCAKPFPKVLNFGNLEQISLKQSINSPEFRQIRKMWVENKTPDFCSRCHYII